MKEFDLKSLAGFDGKDGKPAYFAFRGKVYDATGSKLWGNGTHMNRHSAGRDLTAELSAAPHAEEVFSRLPQVGTMKTEPAATDERVPEYLARLLKRYPILKRHPHPVFSHFPIAFMMAASFFAVIFLFTGVKGFDTTVLYMIGLGILGSFFAIGSGFFTWWLNYGANTMKPVTIKIITSTLLLTDGIILFAWRTASPGILLSLRAAPNFDNVLFFLMVLALFPLSMTLGYFGGNLTFPIEKE